MRASASALQPCSASNRCARRQQVGFLLHCSLAALKLMRAASCKPVFCSDTRDAMAHAAFPCRCTRLHTRREAVQCSAHSQCTLCNRPHGWKGVDLRCRRSPRSELEVFYARNEFTVLAFPFILSGAAAGANRARASVLNEERNAIARQTYRGRQLQTLGCIARAHVEYPLPQSSCSSRAARRKAPPTRAHK